MGRKEAKGGHGQSVPTSSAGTSPPSCPQGRSRTHIRGSRQRQGVALPVQACVRYALRWDACVRGKLRCKGSCEAEQVAGSTLYSRPSAAARSAMLVIARKSLLARPPLPGSRNLLFLLRENGTASTADKVREPANSRPFQKQMSLFSLELPPRRPPLISFPDAVLGFPPGCGFRVFNILDQCSPPAEILRFLV